LNYGYAWGVNDHDHIWNFNNHVWKHIPGGLKWITVSDTNTIFGVNSADMIWQYLGNGNWNNIEGRLKMVHSRNGQLVGTNSNNDLFRLILNP
jgi:hypothetical protein